MNLGFLLYPGVTALDVVGPFEVLVRVPGARPFFIADRVGPIEAQHRLVLHADTSFEETPPLSVLCVPGGPGQVDCLDNPRLLQFLREAGEQAEWVTGVCTGSLVLAAAGLLGGYRATTHWRYLECLRDLGAEPVQKRIVADRNRITGAGVSAGIDLGLFVAGLLAGEKTAQSIQLQIEYDPQPPFRSGSPDVADPEILDAIQSQTQALYDRRRRQCREFISAA